MSSAYCNHFTQDDISEMATFFGSLAGVQMRINPDELDADQRQVIGEFYPGAVSQKMNEVKVELTSDRSQISEFWSRDLFNDAINNLIAKGYNPQ
jgi:hypothetical protein